MGLRIKLPGLQQLELGAEEVKTLYIPVVSVEKQVGIMSYIKYNIFPINIRMSEDFDY